MLKPILPILSVLCAVYVIYMVWFKSPDMSKLNKIIWTVAALFFNIITAIVYKIRM
jgi:hypothetical protein